MSRHSPAKAWEWRENSLLRGNTKRAWFPRGNRQKNQQAEVVATYNSL